MKIGIITFSDRNNMPYLKYYEDILKEEKIQYECIFWDRFTDCSTEKINSEYIIHIKCLPGANKVGKIIPMIRFKYIVENIIQIEQYTHLIILTTLPGVLINRIILKNFKNRYILDIRDYTYEKYKIYKKIVDKLIDNSFFTAISSKGFLRFLDNNKKIIPCHNISNVNYFKEKCVDFKNKKQITIGFLGNIRYFEENRKLIDTFANDLKYRIVYFGRTNVDCDLEGYCKKKNITNVIFKGAFKNEDKPKLYEEIDLINALYGNDSLLVSTPLPNRLYDGILFKKPILAVNGNYFSEIVKNMELGLCLDLDDINLKTKIEHYILNLDFDRLTVNCKKTLLMVTNEQNIFYNEIKKFVIGMCNN